METQKEELLKFNFNLFQKSTLLERFIFFFGEGALEFGEFHFRIPLNPDEIQAYTEERKDCKESVLF